MTKWTRSRASRRSGRRRRAEGGGRGQQERERERRRRRAARARCGASSTRRRRCSTGPIAAMRRSTTSSTRGDRRHPSSSIVFLHTCPQYRSSPSPSPSLPLDVVHSANLVETALIVRPPLPALALLLLLYCFPLPIISGYTCTIHPAPGSCIMTPLCCIDLL